MPSKILRKQVGLGRICADIGLDFMIVGLFRRIDALCEGAF